MGTGFSQTIKNEIKNILEETFVLHHGIYTDKGTSLAQTLEEIDHEKASKSLAGHKETIAGHVFHTTFYIRVLKEYITEVRSGKTDWNESWIVTKVSSTEWTALKQDLFSEYEKLLAFIESEAKWDNEDHFGGVLGIIAHCAYHLGAIRQLKDI